MFSCVGGAIATLLSTDLVTSYGTEDITVNTTSFGSPRVFDKTTAVFVDSIKTGGGLNYYRVINFGDPAPPVPPHQLGHTHVGTAVWYAESLPGSYDDKWTIVKTFDYDGVIHVRNYFKDSVEFHMLDGTRGYINRLICESQCE